MPIKNSRRLPAMGWLHRSLFAVFISLLVTTVCISTLHARSEKPTLIDLTPSGWERDASLQGIQIDRYKTTSNSLSVDLLSFPPTDKPAGQWLDEFIPLMTKKERQAGRKIQVINDDKIGSENVTGPMNKSVDGVDISTRTIMMLRTAKSNSSFLVVRSIIREGQPVQFSLLTLDKGTPSDNEWSQANTLRFKADIPVNKSAAFLGLEAMSAIMTGPLLKLHSPVHQKSAQHQADKKTSDVPVKKPKPETAAQRPVDGVASNKNSAPGFAPLPGPNVRLTGKWLGSLPAGYRMDARTTNYWTSSDMTSTRMLHLTLTRDGQFELGHFSVNGGMGGMVGSVYSGDKKGSVGTVYGDTNPGGPGTKSVALNKRKGLDPNKYGTYYISGSQIEMVYASGKVEKKSFKTDGYKELVIGGKRYFVKTPDGWERRDDKKASKYRSLDESYIARVTRIDREISNGRKWMQDYFSRLRAKNLLHSAGQIQSFKGAYRHYNVVKAPVILKEKNGKQLPRDIYLKYGQRTSRLVQLKRYKGATGEKKMLEFIKYLD